LQLNDFKFTVRSVPLNVICKLKHFETMHRLDSDYLTRLIFFWPETSLIEKLKDPHNCDLTATIYF